MRKIFTLIITLLKKATLTLVFIYFKPSKNILHSNNLASDLNISLAKTQISEHSEMEHLSDLFEEYMTGTLKSDDIKCKDCLSQLKGSLDSMIRRMRDNRTSKLWLQYLDMIWYMNFIRAEQTGNWLLPIKCHEKIFAATGHNWLRKFVKVRQAHRACCLLFQQARHAREQAWRN